MPVAFPVAAPREPLAPLEINPVSFHFLGDCVNQHTWKHSGVKTRKIISEYF